MNIKTIYNLLKPVRETLRCYNTLVNGTLTLINPRPHEQIQIEKTLNEHNIEYMRRIYMYDNEIRAEFIFE